MAAVADYIAALDRAHRCGDATEHTHRPALKTLLEERTATQRAAIAEALKIRFSQLANDYPTI